MTTKRVKSFPNDLPIQNELREALMAGFQRHMLIQAALLCSTNNQTTKINSDLIEKEDGNNEEENKKETKINLIKRPRLELTENNQEENNSSLLNSNQLEQMENILLSRGFQLPNGGLATLNSASPRHDLSIVKDLYLDP
uniref:Uncharacterized protein n=1 Tax=Meloidogyne javanica TaxID=6303 RepID=A0A915M2C8_MELJA